MSKSSFSVLRLGRSARLFGNSGLRCSKGHVGTASSDADTPAVASLCKARSGGRGRHDERDSTAHSGSGNECTARAGRSRVARMDHDLSAPLVCRRVCGSGTAGRQRTTSLESDLGDLSDRVDTLESDLSTLQDESGSSTLESDVQDATTKLSDICDELS